MENFILSENISHELKFLLYSLYLGFVITFLYDNLRVIRRILKHNSGWIAFEDFIFWITVTYGIFSLQYYINRGMFRWFCIFGAFIGMSIYKITIGRFYVNMMTKILKFLLKWLYKILSFILQPVFFLEGKSAALGKKTARKLAFTRNIVKNRLTQRAKMIKMTLCKHKK